MAELFKYRPGSEKVPQRGIDFNDPRLILVIMRRISDDGVVAEERLDYSKSDDRKRLGQLTFWAITNHHSVTTMLLSDVDLPTKDR